MKKSITRTVKLIVVIICISCSGQEQKYSTEVLERIKQVENNLSGWVLTGENDTWTLSDRMKQMNIKGVSIAVINDNKIEWAKGYGYADESENRLVTENTLFQAASISKSLNSLGVLSLVEQGKLDLDSDINNYLVSWKIPYDPKFGNNPVTLRQLLSHTAGLTISGFPGYEQGKELPSLPVILDGMPPANTEAVRLFAEPGKQCVYSGGGTTVSQQIIMDVTKQPYAEYMQQNVLDPLGMISSSYLQPPSDKLEELLATGYHADGTEIDGKYHIYPEQAAAGLWTNPSDLCRYIIETQLAFRGESEKVLSPEMTRLRLKPVLEDAALGSFVNTRVAGSARYFNHNGGNAGFSCTAYGSLDEGKGAVIMTNTDNGSLLEEVLNSIAKVYNWKDFYFPEKKTVVKVSEEQLEKYTGVYDLAGSTGTVKKDADGLVINVIGPDWKLYFTSDSDFFFREYKGSFTFRTGADGRASAIVAEGQELKKVGP